MKPIGPATSVAELLARHPRAVEVLLRRRLPCVGCPADRFHTLADVARCNALRLETLLREIGGLLGRSRTKASEGGVGDPGGTASRSSGERVDPSPSPFGDPQPGETGCSP
jgi:hybrid cluster-associated redox disulfide protein